MLEGPASSAAGVQVLRFPRNDGASVGDAEPELHPAALVESRA